MTLERRKAPGAAWETVLDTGGGSQSIQIADLGIIDMAAVLSGGPVSLRTLNVGQFLSTVRFTDTDYVAPDHHPGAESTAVYFLWFGVGTVKSLGWYGFGGFTQYGTWYDTLALAAKGYAYGPDLGTAGPVAMVLSAAAGGPVQAAMFIGNVQTPVVGAGVICAPIAAWATDTPYDAPADNTPATPGALQNCVVIGNGTMWINIGTGGTSGGMSPDFGANAGATVADGPNIIWSDTSAVPMTTGAVHAVTEIWTPA